MRESDFSANAPGRLEPTTFRETFWKDGVRESKDVPGLGFVPDPLPPAGLTRTQVLDATYEVLVAAERELSRLGGVADQDHLPNPYLLIGPLVQREARLSSAIENTFASAEQIALFDVDPSAVEGDRDDVREVHNYVRALHHALSVTRLPLCTRLITDLHAILLDGVSRPGVRPGKFRTEQNAIGKSNSFADARFVPPPPRFLDELLRDFELYANTKDDGLPRLVRFAILHYQFETIHPFADGNGRLGRLLIPMQVCQTGQLAQPYLYISGYFEKHRDQYCDLLYRVSTQGEWLAWISFFLEAVATQADDAYQRSKKLIALQRRYRNEIASKRRSNVDAAILEHLFASPSITIGKASEIAGVTQPAAGAAIRHLEDSGVLVEVTGREKSRVYVAREIIDIINSDTP